jgi:hypothetical protein
MQTTSRGTGRLVLQSLLMAALAAAVYLLLEPLGLPDAGPDRLIAERGRFIYGLDASVIGASVLLGVMVFPTRATGGQKAARFGPALGMYWWYLVITPGSWISLVLFLPFMLGLPPIWPNAAAFQEMVAGAFVHLMPLSTCGVYGGFVMRRLRNGWPAVGLVLGGFVDYTLMEHQGLPAGYSALFWLPVSLAVWPGIAWAGIVLAWFFRRTRDSD